MADRHLVGAHLGSEAGEPADMGQRLVARIIDTLVVGLPVVLISRAALPQITADVVASVGLSALLLLYESVQLALWGQTLGKRFTGVVVVPAGSDAAGDAAGDVAGNAAGDIECRDLGFGRAVVRSAVYALPIAVRLVPVLGAIAGVVWVANAAAVFERPMRRALHDHAAGTYVVRIGR